MNKENKQIILGALFLLVLATTIGYLVSIKSVHEERMDRIEELNELVDLQESIGIRTMMIEADSLIKVINKDLNETKE
jgi:hypothetical protein